MGICYVCSNEDETRPYGPAGESICFDCAMSTPEKKKQTELAFEMQLNAAGPVVLLGEEFGPIPYVNSRNALH